MPPSHAPPPSSSAAIACASATPLSAAARRRGGRRRRRRRSRRTRRRAARRRAGARRPACSRVGCAWSHAKACAWRTRGAAQLPSSPAAIAASAAACSSAATAGGSSRSGGSSPRRCAAAYSAVVCATHSSTPSRGSRPGFDESRTSSVSGAGSAGGRSTAADAGAAACRVALEREHEDDGARGSEAPRQREWTPLVGRQDRVRIRKAEACPTARARRSGAPRRRRRRGWWRARPTRRSRHHGGRRARGGRTAARLPRAPPPARREGGKVRDSTVSRPTRRFRPPASAPQLPPAPTLAEVRQNRETRR